MKPDRGYQANFYDQHPSIHDLDRRRQKAEKIRILLAAIEGFPFEKSVCLDIGCSSGVQTCELAPLFAHIFGIDFDDIVLSKHDRMEGCPAGFLQGDAMFLPFRSASVDVLICAQVYEHVPDDVHLVEEMARVLRPGGIIFFSGPNKLFPIEPHYYLPFLHWLPGALADAYLRLFRLGNHYYERSRTIWGLRRLFRGFEIRDATLQVLAMSGALAGKGFTASLLSGIPRPVWAWLLPLFPNFNWILRKPEGNAL